MFDLFTTIIRQIVFSRGAFGPGDRTKGVIKHIRKELDEIEAEPLPIDRAEEFVDVVILGIEGMWRNIAAHSPHFSTDDIAEEMIGMIRQKQNKNERREWPDWRATTVDHPIEHVRGKHD